MDIKELNAKFDQGMEQLEGNILKHARLLDETEELKEDFLQDMEKIRNEYKETIDIQLQKVNEYKNRIADIFSELEKEKGILQGQLRNISTQYEQKWLSAEKKQQEELSGVLQQILDVKEKMASEKMDSIDQVYTCNEKMGAMERHVKEKSESLSEKILKLEEKLVNTRLAVMITVIIMLITFFALGR